MRFRRLGVLNMTGRIPEPVEFGPFRFIPGDGLWRGHDQVALPPRALGVLTRLLANSGAVVTKQELSDYLYPHGDDRDSNVLEVLVGRLRRKLDPEGSLAPIETLRGRGYRFTLG